MKILPAMMLLSAVPAGAGAQDLPQSVHISYSDLNLASAEGVRTLDRRLKRAVRAVCPNPDEMTDMGRKIIAMRCVTAKTAEVAAERDRVLAAHAGATVIASRFR